MKILKVILRNIHSLKGDHTIDFASGVLANAGLYAITGQTGAGKSTILDAITLALYGQCNRHGNTKSEEEIITRNEKEAFAETTFEVDHEIYVARWAASYTRTRKLKATERRLFKKEQDKLRLLFEGVTLTQNAIHAIVGLNFDQFTKSVLLAQNNFSAFLKAKPSERAEMLSKITGTQIYEDISKATFEQTTILKEEINHLNAQLSGDLLDEATLELLKDQLIEKSSSLETLKLSLQNIADKIALIKEHTSLQLEIENLEINIKQIEAIQTENKPQFELLDKYQKALLLQNELNKYEQTLLNIESTHNEIIACKSILSQTKIEAETLQTAIATHTQASNAVEKELETKLPTINEAKKLQIDLDHKTSSLQETNVVLDQYQKQQLQYQTKIEAFTKQQHSIAADLKNEQNIIDQNHQYATWETQRSVVVNHYTQITSAQKSIQELHTATLKEQLVAQHNKLFSVQTDLTIHQEKLHQEEQYLSVLTSQLLEYTSFENLSIEKDHLQQQQLMLEKLIIEIQEQSRLTLQQEQLRVNEQALMLSIDNLKTALEKQTLMVTVLNDNYVLTQRIASLEVHRQALTDGAPCPLCGAIHHPFAAQIPVIDASKAKMLEAENELTSFRSQLNTKEKSLALVLADLKNNATQLHTIELSIAALTQELSVTSELEKTLQFQEELKKKADANQLQLMASQRLKDQLVSQNNVIKQATETVNTTILTTANLKNEIELQTQALQNQEAIIEEKKENIQLSFKEILSIFKEYGEPLAENNIAQAKEIAIKLSSNFKLYSEATAASNSIKEKLAAIQTSLTEVSALSHNLEKEIILQTEKQQHQSADNKLIATQLTNIVSGFVKHNPIEEEKRLRSELTILQEKTNLALSRQAATIALINEKNQFLQKQEQTKESNEIVLEKISQTLFQQLKDNEFESIEDLKFAISLPHHEQIKAQKETLAKEQQQLKGALTNAQGKFQSIISNRLPNENLDELHDQYQSIDTQQNSIHQEIGSIREQLRKNELDVSQNQQKIAVIKDKAVIFQKWQQLNSLIGSKTGDSFKKFAQDFTLSLLIQHANRHLKVMFNRYELYKSENSTEMELQIKDKNFFDDIRNINSLSGGETFLVSLALALGLSDLASKKTKIRSLFIDEGFGTLDPENLNNALDALELLRQTEDRQIGIISHVEELKKRIHTQVQVSKTSAEFSKIIIVD